MTGGFGGTRAGDEAARDAQLWGLDPLDFAPVPDPDAGLWAGHLPAFEAFLTVTTQWRVSSGMAGERVLGLDYTAVKAGFDLAGIVCTAPLWADIRVLEAAAVAAMNGGDDDF